MIRIYIEIPN